MSFNKVLNFFSETHMCVYPLVAKCHIVLDLLRFAKKLRSFQR